MTPSRAIARSNRGMIASPHVAASAAGLEMLKNGGNAVDAAIAANAVLAVVYPASCGLGGDLFALLYKPKSELFAFNGSGRAPKELDARSLRARGMTSMPNRGALAVTVPGAVRAWADLALAHGTLALDDLLRPAQRLASDGFVVTEVVAEYVKRNADVLQADRQARMLFCNRGNVHPGDVVRNEALAESIRAIRKEGPNVFYSGRIAESIVRTLRSLGSPMTLGDLASHRTESPAPVRMPWRDLEICAHPPNSQGVVAPLVQCMLEGDAAEPQAQWMHLAIEAFKLAFEERDSRIGDPETTKPIDDLLAPTMIAYLRSRIDPTRAAIRQLAPQEGGTVAIVCVDADGRAISLIQSLFMGFGSGIVAEGTGIFLHNRGAYFSLEPGHPNELHGGKRPLHTLSPAMALKNGRPFLVYGTMGGDGQPQTQVQLLHNILERGMNVQEAIDAPRFVYGRDSESQFVDNVRIESRFDAETISLLRARGHKVIQLQPFDHAAGHAQVIQIDEARGSMAGGADPRADSAALPL